MTAQMVVYKVEPCADLPDAVQISGQITGIGLAEIQSQIALLGFAALRLDSTHGLTAFLGRALLICSNDLAFTLTRVADEDTGMAMLERLLDCTPK